LLVPFIQGCTDGRQSWRIWSEKNIGEASPVAPGEFWLVSLRNGWVVNPKGSGSKWGED